MSTIVRTYRHGDKLVEICVDEDPQDPRAEWDQAGIFWCWHKRYNIGDKDVVTRHGKKFRKSDFDPSNFGNFDELAAAIYTVHRAVLVLPVYLMDHGGQSLSVRDFHDRWDSGQVGVIWLPREGLADIGYKIATARAKDKAEELLKAEVTVQDAYISGSVFGWQSYELVVRDGESSRGEFLDSCWGYYGTKEIPYMLECALGSAEAAKAAEELDEHEARDLRAA